MPWPQTGATQYHAQLGLPDKGRAILVNTTTNYLCRIKNCMKNIFVSHPYT